VQYITNYISIAIDISKSLFIHR